MTRRRFVSLSVPAAALLTEACGHKHKAINTPPPPVPGPTTAPTTETAAPPTRARTQPPVLTTPSDTEPETVLYEEHRTAQRWPLVMSGLLGAFLIVVGILLTAASLALVFGVLSLLGLLLWNRTNGHEYFRYRRTGIRITTRRLTAGAVGSAADRDLAEGAALGTVNRLGKCAFSCDWEGVKALAVVADPNTIATMRTRTGARVDGVPKVVTHKLGHMVPPYAKAVLVISVDHDIAGFPEEHARRNVVNLQSPTWIVPTRQPELLRKALASLPPAASGNVLRPLNYQWLSEILD